MTSRKTTILHVQVRSRTVVLERAREGLGRDLDNLSEEARLLQEAREELARCFTNHLVDNCNLNQNDLSGSKTSEQPGLRRWLQ